MARYSRKEFLSKLTSSVVTLTAANIGVYAVGAAFKELNGGVAVYGQKYGDACGDCLTNCALGGSAGAPPHQVHSEVTSRRLYDLS